MGFGGLSREAGEPAAEINMIPLVDVMLVLLVIFIVTAPVMTHAVKVEIPTASSEVNRPGTGTVALAITRDGALHWNGDAIETSRLTPRLEALAATGDALHIHADRAVTYERLARVLAAARRAGIRSIGFVSQPEGAP